MRVSKIKTKANTNALTYLLFVYFYHTIFLSLVVLSYFGIFACFVLFSYLQRCKNKRYDNNIWHTAVCVIHWHSVTVMVMTTPNALNVAHICIYPLFMLGNVFTLQGKLVHDFVKYTWKCSTVLIEGMNNEFWNFKREKY